MLLSIASYLSFFSSLENERISYEKVSDNSTLTIRRVAKSDAGQYFMTMENSVGRKELSFTVNVYGKLCTAYSVFPIAEIEFFTFLSTAIGKLHKI